MTRAGLDLRAIDEIRALGRALLESLAFDHERGVVRGDLRGPAAVDALAYLAPEQLTGAPAIDARADLWAVGAILYELLAGVAPYRAARIGEKLAAVALSEPVPLQVHVPQIAAALGAFFATALARDPSRRFASARDMARALEAAPLESAVVDPPSAVRALPQGEQKRSLLARLLRA